MSRINSISMLHPFLPASARILVPIQILLLSAVLLSGCISLTDTEGSQEQRRDTVATLGEGASFKQTFISRRAGLNRVELWLRSPGEEVQPAGSVTVELRRNPDDAQPLAATVITPEVLAGAETVSLDFPALGDSRGARYELRLINSGGEAQILGSFEDVYGPGSANMNGEFLLADAAFRLSYDYGLTGVLEDIGSMLRNAWLLVLVALLLLGWLILVWSGLDRAHDPGERAALALGISLAVIPLAMAWTSLAGLHWSRPAVLAATGFLLALAIYTQWHRYGKHLKGVRLALRPRLLARLKAGPSITIALFGIFLISLYVRTAMVRDLSASPWVDSVHHALITRLIVEQGAFPSSYAPYIDVSAASYHPGFHSVLASFLWLSAMPLMPGMLFFGQVLNALCIFPVYLFTITLTRSRLAGLLAGLAAGLFTPMPAYYTSWGRYTQLAALIILPTALALVLHAIQVPEKPAANTSSIFKRIRWKVVVAAALCLAGLFLTHYRVAAFAGCLLLAWGLVAAAGRVLRDHASYQSWFAMLLNRLLALLAVGVLALGLSLPWLLPSLQNLLLPRLSSWQPATPQQFSGVTWPYLNAAWGGFVLVLAVLGFGWGLLRQRVFPIILVVWVGLLFFIANLGVFGLPGSGFVNEISVTITLFLPLSALAGYMLAEVALAWKRVISARWLGAYRWGLALLGVVVAGLAARQLIPLLNPVTFIFRPADQAGIEWVVENIPSGETLLVNPFAWGYGQYAGNDGGYWISAIGERPTFPPPVLYGLSNSPEYITNINTTSQQVIDSANDPQALHSLLQEQKIRYVFIGGRGGVLSPQLLRASPLFAPRYSRGGVFVFEVLP